MLAADLGKHEWIEGDFDRLCEALR